MHFVKRNVTSNALQSSLNSGTPNDRFGKFSVQKARNPSDLLKRIVTSNFRDMRNLMSAVSGLLKTVVLSSEKRSAIIFEKTIRPRVSGNGQKIPNKYENTQVSLE